MKTIDNNEKELKVTVQCESHEEQDKLLSFVKHFNSKIYVQKNGREYILAMEDIYYIESLEKTTIIYTQNDSYVSMMWLYQIEAMLSDDFVRINKSTIINLSFLKNMKSDMGSRIRLEFNNGDKFMVTRAYVKAFKRKLGGN